RLLLHLAVVADDGDLAFATDQFDAHDARELGDLRGALRRTGLEELHHARQTVRDVALGHTTGVEGPHGELRAGLADGLRGDDTDGLTELDQLVRRERQTVAVGTHALDGVTGQRRANSHAIHRRVLTQQFDVVDHQHGARR